MSLVDLTSSPSHEDQISHEETKPTDANARDVTISSSNLDANPEAVVKDATYDDPQGLETSSTAKTQPIAPSKAADEPLIFLESSQATSPGTSERQSQQAIQEAPTEGSSKSALSMASQKRTSESLNNDLERLSLGESPAGTEGVAHTAEGTNITHPPQPPPKDDRYLRQPLPSSSTPSRKASPMPNAKQGSSGEEWNEKEPYEDTSRRGQQNLVDSDFDDKAREEEDNTEESGAEISSIIEQFTGDKASNPGISSPTSRAPHASTFPPRSSSLGHLTQPAQDPGAVTSDEASLMSPISPPKDPERASVSYAGSIKSQAAPPAPDPEPDLPFEFHRFIEQLRLRAADPVAKFLRSFLQEFGKKQWQVHEQVKIIGDFLAFISNRMAQCEVWRSASDAEFDNAREGMEKLVMNRLYTQTFSPEIPAGEASPIKGRRKGTSTPLGPGRKGQHQEDVERDEVLAQKIRIYSWLREEHLDMKPFNDKGRKFLLLAQQELAKIKSYRAPRDKIICVLNSCKVIFGYLRNSASDQSADTFIPLLIYTVLKANPDHLVSNLQYILRFRNQEKLGGEAGYYLSSLMGAVQFIENLDRTNITVSDEEFERNVEAAVSEIAAHNEQEEKRHSAPPPATLQAPLIPDKSTLSRPELARPQSGDGERSNLRRSALTNSTEDQSSEEKAAVSGLLRTIQRPLSTIGRIFSDEATATIISPSGQSSDRPPATPQPTPRPTRTPGLPSNSSAPPGAAAAESRTRLRAEDAAALQASAEAAEAHTIMQAEHHTVVDTLSGMFPDLDREIISDVVRMKEGRIGLAVDACLVLSR